MSQEDIPAHAILKKDEKILMKQAYENIAIISKVTTDTNSLKKALTGQALESLTNQINQDLAQGKVKIRKYSSVKLDFKNYTKGVAGLRLDLVDKTYYVDKDTKKRISSPSNKKERRIIALKKDGKRWKIFAFFDVKIKEKKK